MTSLFTLTFQGEVSEAGGLHPEDAREVVRAAFPLSPPRDAALRDGYRAYKMTRLESGRHLLASISKRGDVDSYERPVLRAVGCVVDGDELGGSLRDPSAAWEVLDELEISTGVAAFEARVAERSIHASQAAFERFRADLDTSGDFYARVAAALGEERVDLYVGDVVEAPARLRPAFGLLTLETLASLDLAIGGEPSDLREPLLGLPGAIPDELRKGGFLSKLLGRGGKGLEGVAIDFGSGEVFGSRAKGPRALVAALVDRQPWPLDITEAERYAALMRCLDEERSLFEILPELDELRRIVKHFEDLSKDLARGR